MNKQDAIKHFGGVNKLAAALKIKPPSVSGWKEIPIPRQFQIQVITNGKLKADKI